MSFWTEEKLFFDGDAYFGYLEALIRSAKRSIEIETYIWDDDAIGRRIADALCAASRRGVNVRAMVDGMGSPQWGAVFLPHLRSSGVQARVFHPLPWQILSKSLPAPETRRNKWTLLQWLVHVLFKVNVRDHRKVFVMDGEVACVGGVNISANHSRSIKGQSAWRDTSVSVKGVDIAAILYAFEKAWLHAWDFTSRKPRWYNVRRLRSLKTESRLVRVNHTLMRRRRTYRDLLRRLGRATQRVWVTNAYFIPDGSLIRRLRRVAKKGVDVRILVPRISDVFFVRWVSSAFYYALLKSGARIFEYEPRVLHAKTLLVDDWAVVGSSNLNHRSLFHDLEMDIELTAIQSKRAMEQQYLEDIGQSVEIKMKDWKARPWTDKLLGQIFLLAKYWF
jgi:cardiolipin synthase